MKDLKFLFLGILFAFFWSSASVAAKIGIKFMEPLMLFQFRFLLAGITLLAYHIFFEKFQMPKKQEWVALSVFGFFNITLYLSLFVLGINEVAAGIGSLSTSLTPVMMTLISGFWLGKKIKLNQIIGLILGLFGVGIAVWPLLFNSFATYRGIIYLILSMLSYSVGSIYFSEKKWNLSRIAINGWQVLLGGLFMLPLTLFLQQKPIIFNWQSSLSILWLAFPVSILAVNLWLRLIKLNTVKASFFLFLCPIFGFIFSGILLNEPFTYHTLTGLISVLSGLYIGQKNI